LHLVIYDADCRICTKTVNKLKKWVPNSFVTKPSSSELITKLEELTGKAMQPDRYMYYINLSSLETTKGYDAFRSVFALNQNTRWLSFIMSFPLIKPIGRVVYRIFANNRRRFSGTGAKCGV